MHSFQKQLSADYGVEFPAYCAEELAPSGTLRAAINFGNQVMAQYGDSGQPKGITVALAHELAHCLGLPLELVPFASAGDVCVAATEDVWDIAFLAHDPKRAETIDFSRPYVVIEGSYLVATDSPYRCQADLDQAGVLIAVGKNAAYDLFLSRTLDQARLVRAETTPAAVDLFRVHKLDAAAGVRGPLLAYAATHPDVRVVEDNFMEIHQSLALPAGRSQGLYYLNAFISEMLDSGFVRSTLDENAQSDVRVAEQP